MIEFYTQESFKNWLETQQTSNQELLAKFVPQDLVAQLDYAPASLAPLGEWLVDEYTNLEELKNQQHVWKYGTLTYYAGETIPKSVWGVLVCLS